MSTLISIWMPGHKNKGNFDPGAKNKSFSTATQKKSMPIHHTEMKSFSTTHTTTKSISSYTGIESSSISHTEIKSICTAHTKCKSIGMLTLTTSDFRPVFKNQVNFDHPHKINFIPTLKSSQTRSPTLKSRQIGLSPKPSQFPW